MNAPPIWTPDATRASQSHMQRFIERHAGALAAPDYASLYAWSRAEPEQFWAGVWDYCGVDASRPYDRVVERFDRMLDAKWFPGARLNYAQNLLRGEPPGPAIVFVNERGARVEIGRDALERRVAALAASLRALGVEPGDRVAGICANVPETVVAALAAASVGAVWSSCSPEFGTGAILDRLGQIEPKVLFATDGYFYSGKSIDCLPAIAEVARRLPGLRAVGIVAYRDAAPDLSRIPLARRFEDLVEPAAEPDYRQLPFDHPLAILYSSGTTGKPKCIVHGAGGTLIQHLKEHVLHTDIGPGDVVFYFTTCGWMMWNWLLGALAAKATIVLYDGAPLAPAPEILWRIAERERVTVFGTSAKYLSALENSGYRPADRVDLGALRSILSTGSPLAPSQFDFVHAHVKADVQLASIAGGTDIVSCFVLGNPLLPVYRGEIQCRGLGMAVEIFDEHGAAVRERKGELVCTAPFPSMPIGFWNDPDKRRYRAAYFERYDNVWHHGDYAELTAHDGIVMYGRSDAVLNPGGVRIGTAEIYRVVEQLDAIDESIVAGQEWEGDTRIVLFVRLAPGFTLDAALEAEIRARVRRDASPRHVPAKILAVDDIPRTLSGKIVELAVRDVIHGRAIGNRDALANPEALEQFRDRPELET